MRASPGARRHCPPGNERHINHELPDLAKVIGNKVLAIFPQAWCALTPSPLCIHGAGTLLCKRLVAV